MRATLFPLLLLAAAAGAPAAAQSPLPSLDPGQYVRVTRTCEPGDLPCRAEGRVVLVAPDSLVLRSSTAGTTGIPWSTMARLQRSTGSTSRWKEGGAIGFVAGAVVTLAVLGSGGRGSGGNLCDPDSDDDAMGWPACFAIASGVGLGTGGLGALIGSGVRRHRWADVPLAAGVGR